MECRLLVWRKTAKKPPEIRCGGFLGVRQCRFTGFRLPETQKRPIWALLGAVSGVLVGFWAREKRQGVAAVVSRFFCL